MATNPSMEPSLGIQVTGSMQPGYEDILSPGALEFVAMATPRRDLIGTLVPSRPQVKYMVS